MTLQLPHKDTNANIRPEQKGEGHLIPDIKYQLN